MLEHEKNVWQISGNWNFVSSSQFAYLDYWNNGKEDMSDSGTQKLFEFKIIFLTTVKFYQLLYYSPLLSILAMFH